MALLAVPGVLRLSVVAGLRADLQALGRTVPTLAGVATGEAADLAVADRAPDAGRHLGFDTSVYPGDRAMRAWKASDAPYEWVGYYLPAPCHRDASWSGRRRALADMGWGTAVIYVGQQTWGRTPRPGSRAAPAAARRGAVCDADLVSGPRGEVEAADAVARTAAEGFARGTVIFLDLEYMASVPPAMRDYYRAWVARVLADGRFVPGVYVHTRNAAEVYRDMQAVFAQAGVAHTPHVWVADGRRFAPDKPPQATGHAFASAWQGVLDVVQRWNGVALSIDVNVARVPSPSDHESLTHVAAVSPAAAPPTTPADARRMAMERAAGVAE
ncbi:glycoside hydrolase domain-containing protein [Roseisolibacter agri]|uniref:glycoside hydrolase domain-containing protein n=1 Tax=Roseisolibacter agri TaxID=2014610 RepID=UPI0024E1280C|nr:glycoside hydrolase domain-containing protein [Roseisolibacter agri]